NDPRPDSLSSHLRRWISRGCRLAGAQRRQRGGSQEYVRGLVVRSMVCAALLPPHRGRAASWEPVGVLVPTFPAGLFSIGTASIGDTRRLNRARTASEMTAASIRKPGGVGFKWKRRP